MSRRPRRVMAQMNVVPYIDVMLVLLVIFMVAAPMMQPGVINLPTVAKAEAPPATPLEVSIDAAGALTLRDSDLNSPDTTRGLSLNDMVDRIKQRLAAKPGRPVLISADKNVRYEKVMQVMDRLQREQVSRVGLLVKPQK